MRIVVMGQAGSGKTTLALQLATRLGVPDVDLDAHHHLADWTPNPDFAASVEAAVPVDDDWVVHGNYLAVRDLVLGRADVVIWLDLLRIVPVLRAARRTWLRLRTREVLWNGNTERWRNLLDPDHPIWWAWTTAPKHRRDYPQSFAPHPHLRIYRVRRSNELPGLIVGLTGVAPSSDPEVRGDNGVPLE